MKDFQKRMSILRNIAKIFLEKFCGPELSCKIKCLYYERLIKNFDLSGEPDLNMVKLFVHEGDVVFDIGANIGIYTHYLSKQTGIKGEVHSFEPVPETFVILKKIVEKKSLSNVCLNNIAVSESEGTKKMFIPRDEIGFLNYYQAAIKPNNNADKSDSRSFNVPCISLDNYAKKINKKITFIKCDVEGHELYVIKGANNLLQDDRPVWLLEISSDLNNVNSDAGEIFEIFKKDDYHFYVREGSALRPYRGDLTCLNYFLIPIEKTNIFK